MSAKPTSVEVWRGPSKLTGDPIVAIVTSLVRPSDNAKTGGMAQLWILPATVEPHTAVATGADRSVCGDCPLRPSAQGGCYVTTMRAPLGIHRAHGRGNVPRQAPLVVSRRLQAGGLPLRLGAWGDPAALPIAVVRDLVRYAPRWTGYTHQWRTTRGARLRPYCMASVETPEQATQAQGSGWRTFRTSRQGAGLGEIVCPASAEAGHRTDCSRCTLCDGARAGDRRRSIVIAPHGFAAGRL